MRSDRRGGRGTLRRVVTAAQAVVLLLFLASLASAQDQKSIEDAPGYFPLERFGLLPPESLSVEINLSKGLLSLAAAAMSEEDPDFAELVRGLDAIRVRAAPADELDLDALRRKVKEASKWLEQTGWETMLRFRDEGEEVYIYTRVLEGSMVGLALMVIEPGDDVVVLNLVGPLDFRLMSGLAESLDLPELGMVVGGEKADPEETP